MYFEVGRQKKFRFLLISLRLCQFIVSRQSSRTALTVAWKDVLLSRWKTERS